MRTAGKLILKIWESPTFTTWGSFLSKSLYAVLLLPVITTVLSPEDITIWLLFNILIGLQNIGDLGFGVTFIRVMSYAMGGATDISDFGKTGKIYNKKGPNWNLLERSDTATKYLLLYTSLVFILIISISGYFTLKKPISFTIEQGNAWIAFVLILFTTFIRFNGNRYSIFLQGVNHVAMLRRWEAIISVLSIFSGFFVAVTTRSLLWLIVNQQIWALIQMLFNRYLCRNILEGRFRRFRPDGLDKELVKAIFPAAWKSWVGVLMSYGVVQASGLVVAQMGNTVSVSAYLFSLKILDIIKNFSNAPFYSKIPLYNRLFAEGNRNGLLARVKNGMRFSLLTFSFSAIFIGIAGQPLLKLIGSNVTLVSDWIWITMIFAYFFERYGALHLQFYSITNDIVWHIANGVSGFIFIGLSFVFAAVLSLGIISFPLALIISSLSFFVWYSAAKSYKYFNLEFPGFEYKTSFYPFLLLVAYLVSELIVF
jgi:O-antigen/teichoic acid export membrane protein